MGRTVPQKEEHLNPKAQRDQGSIVSERSPDQLALGMKRKRRMKKGWEKQVRINIGFFKVVLGFWTDTRRKRRH